jgi:putative nucleotidyltransferase with HDIG domain
VMNEGQWVEAREWFGRYGAGFAGADGALHPLLQGKASHSRRVAANAEEIARDAGLADGEVLFARTAGLLHDVGRFPQFRDFGTFSDPRSIDHGERGHAALSEDPHFSLLDMPNREDLLASVRYHNKRVLPDTLSPGERRLTDIVRDADKLDIFKVILDALDNGDFEKNATVFLHAVPEGPPNPVIVQCIREGRTASYADIRCRTDFGLQLLSWAFDLSFDGTCRRLIERGWFDGIIAKLPSYPEVEEAAAIARTHLMRRCG